MILGVVLRGRYGGPDDVRAGRVVHANDWQLSSECLEIAIYTDSTNPMFMLAFCLIISP